MYDGIDSRVINDGFMLRMQAHEYRLFLDACASGGEHPEYLRLHGRKLNSEHFGITAQQVATHKNSKKRRQTSGRLGFDPDPRCLSKKTEKRNRSLQLHKEKHRRLDNQWAKKLCCNVRKSWVFSTSAPL